MFYPVLAAVRAGRAMLSAFPARVIFAPRVKSPFVLNWNDVRTEMANTVSAGTPGVPVLFGKDGGAEQQEEPSGKKFWLVDCPYEPGDFLKLQTGFAVSIALIEDGSSSAGVVYVPVRDMVYFAVKGLGSFRLHGADLGAVFQTFITGRFAEALPLHRSEAGSLGAAILRKATLLNPCRSARPLSRPMRIAAGKYHHDSQIREFTRRLSSRHASVQVTVSGSLAFCLIAEGRADVYCGFGPCREEGIAAGNIIVQESGGSVVALETGGPLVYNQGVLHNPPFIATAAWCLDKSFAALRTCYGTTIASAGHDLIQARSAFA